MTTFSTAIRTFPELTQEEIGERVWRKRDSITHAVTNISTLNNRVIAQLPNQPPNIADLRTLQAGDTFLGQGTFGSLTETHLYTVLKSKGDILWFYYHNPGDAIIGPYELKISEPKITYLVYRKRESSEPSIGMISIKAIYLKEEENKVV